MIVRVHPLVAALTSKDCPGLEDSAVHERTARFLGILHQQLASTLPTLVKKERTLSHAQAEDTRG